MKLTQAQIDVISEASLVELRTPSEMLTLLLIEGLRFYFMDREQQWYRRDDNGTAIHFSPDEYQAKLMDELMEICQIKEFINQNS